MSRLKSHHRYRYVYKGTIYTSINCNTCLYTHLATLAKTYREADILLDCKCFKSLNINITLHVQRITAAPFFRPKGHKFEVLLFKPINT